MNKPETCTGNKAVITAILFTICVMLLFCGCASSKPSIGDIKTVPGPDESVLIFYRGALHFAAPPYPVYVNGVEMFSLKAKQTARLIVPNGVHELSGIVPSRYRDTFRPKKISVNSEEVKLEIRAEVIQGYPELNLNFIEEKRKKLKK